MEPADDLPAPLRALLPGMVALVLALSQDVALFPDGWELAWANRCLWGLDGGPLRCEELDPAFRPPGTALWVGPLSLLLRAPVALGLLSLVSLSLCAIPLGALGRQLAGEPGRLAAVLLLVATPELASWALVPDARGPALLLTLSAWVLLLRPDSRGLALAGLLMGLGPLFRTETWAGLLLLPVAAVLLHRWQARAALLGAGIGAALSIGLGSWAAGRLVFAARGWEGRALELGRLVPLDWAKLHFGLGIWAPSMRQVAIEAPGATTSAGQMLDLGEGFRFLGEALGQGQLLFLWILAGLGAVRAAQSPSGRRVLLVLAGAAASQVAATLLFQARNPNLPLSNLLAPLSAGVVLAGAGAVTLAELVRGSARRRARLALALLVAALVALLSPPPRLQPSLELSSPGSGAVVFLRSELGPGERVISSFETGPVAMRAEVPWSQWPSPWDTGGWTQESWVLLSSLDAGLPAPLPPGLDLEPRALYRGPEGWVLVAELSARTP